MRHRARVAVAPVYLFACLVLGGSAQGVWQNAALQLVGIAVIAWAAAESNSDSVSPAAKQGLLIAIFGIALVALQLIPLPPNIWTELGPRGQIADGYRALGLPLPMQSVSLDPYESLSSLLGVIPPLAIFCAMVRLKAYRARWMALALVCGTLAAILLGALQVTSQAQQSPWYLYRDTNRGSAVGFFANANHMATLLVITIPFLAAIGAAARTGNRQRHLAVVALCAGMGLVVLVGLALNRSLAGYGIALPVLAASALIVLPRDSRWRIWVVALAALLVIAAVAALQTVPIGGTKFGEDATTSVQSRAEILTRSSRAISEFMPFGSGLGTFREVYHLFEQPSEVTTTYVVHAHNDYVELALEMGVGGVIVLMLFLAWWWASARRAWSTANVGPFGLAATIASASVLVHSLVDFPLRTAAIASCFGMCLALLADRRAPAPREPSDLRPTRHVTIG